LDHPLQIGLPIMVHETLARDVNARKGCVV